MDKAHVVALETRHAGLEARIDAEHHRPHPDDLTLVALKKRKLQLKDTISGGVQVRD